MIINETNVLIVQENYTRSKEEKMTKISIKVEQTKPKSSRSQSKKEGKNYKAKVVAFQ